VIALEGGCEFAFPAALAEGLAGGLSRSSNKAKASRENGKRGGRPRDLPSDGSSNQAAQSPTIIWGSGFDLASRVQMGGVRRQVDHPLMTHSPK